MGQSGLFAADLSSAAKDWVPLAAAVTAALVAGWFGGRNARKTPHERLKALVEIAKDMPHGLDDDDTVSRAIQRELRLIESLNTARERSVWQYVVAVVMARRIELLTTSLVMCALAAIVWFGLWQTIGNAVLVSLLPMLMLTLIAGIVLAFRS